MRWAPEERGTSMSTEHSMQPTAMETHQHHSHDNDHHQRWKPKRSLRDYLPLIIIVLVASHSAFASQWAHGGWDGMSWMRQFMGIFLVIFAMFKLFDLR